MSSPRLHMWSWQHIRHHRQHVKKYREIYKNKITSKKPAESLLKEFEVGEHWACSVKDNGNLLLFTDCHVIPNKYAVIYSVMLFQTNMLLFFRLSRHMAAFLFLFSLVKAVIRMSCLCDLANIVVLFWSLVQWIDKYIFVCFVFMFCFVLFWSLVQWIEKHIFGVFVCVCGCVFFILYFLWLFSFYLFCFKVKRGDYDCLCKLSNIILFVLVFCLFVCFVLEFDSCGHCELSLWTAKYGCFVLFYFCLFVCFVS